MHTSLVASGYPRISCHQTRSGYVCGGQGAQFWTCCPCGSKVIVIQGSPRRDAFTDPERDGARVSGVMLLDTETAQSTHTGNVHNLWKKWALP